MTGRTAIPDGVAQPLGYDKQAEPVLRDRLTSLDWPKFLHPFPLNEHYLLVSSKVSPQSDWGIYLVDTFGNMMLIHEQPSDALLEPIPLQPTRRPPVIAHRVDLNRHDGVVYLQDIYAGPGLAGVPRGTLKLLRVISYEFGYRGLTAFDKIGIDGPLSRNVARSATHPVQRFRTQTGIGCAVCRLRP